MLVGSQGTVKPEMKC